MLAATFWRNRKRGQEPNPRLMRRFGVARNLVSLSAASRRLRLETTSGFRASPGI